MGASSTFWSLPRAQAGVCRQAGATKGESVASATCREDSPFELLLYHFSILGRSALQPRRGGCLIALLGVVCARPHRKIATSPNEFGFSDRQNFGANANPSRLPKLTGTEHAHPRRSIARTGPPASSQPHLRIQLSAPAAPACNQAAASRRGRRGVVID